MTVFLNRAVGIEVLRLRRAIRFAYGSAPLRMTGVGLLLFFILILSGFASAQTLTGTITNKTNGKPGAGDDVILLNLAQGMEEAGRTKADGKGNFSLKLDGNSNPHLVRVIHQGVTYHRMAPPGTTSVEVDVFDAAKKVDGISVTADVMRLQAKEGELEAVRLLAVNNTSEPPRTQMNDANFEFTLPEGAVVETGMARTANGNPLTQSPTALKEKNHYAFDFPLRPGETQFQVVYHLPYSGSLSIDPKLAYGTQHFVVMVPKTMQFTAGPGAAFQSMEDPQQVGTTVQVVSNTKPGQALSFKVSGTGVMTEAGTGGTTDGGEGGSASRTSSSSSEMRPGGGLGPPIDAPDPLEKYRWPMLGGFALLLAVGAVYIARRSGRAVSAATDFASDMELRDRAAALPRKATAAPPLPAPATGVNGGASAGLLNVLKDEIFQLEMEHKQGQISQAEYDKAKAGLDQTLERALKRAGRNP